MRPRSALAGLDRTVQHSTAAIDRRSYPLAAWARRRDLRAWADTQCTPTRFTAEESRRGAIEGGRVVHALANAAPTSAACSMCPNGGSTVPWDGRGRLYCLTHHGLLSTPENDTRADGE